MKRVGVMIFLIVLSHFIFGQGAIENDKKDEKRDVMKTGGIDAYVGFFPSTENSIDDYTPVEAATIKIFNEKDVSLTYSGTTDQKGYLRLDGIMPGKYLISVENYEGDYFFKDGVLIVKENDDSKVYLHLELESTGLANTKAKVQEKKIDSLFQNLVGKIIEVSKSHHVEVDKTVKEEKEQ